MGALWIVCLLSILPCLPGTVLKNSRHKEQPMRYAFIRKNSSDTLQQKLVNTFKLIAEMFENDTCLRFKEVDEAGSLKNVYQIISDNDDYKGCWSTFGWQKLFGNVKQSCWWYNRLKHEFSHGLGLDHEHQHPNAGAYITPNQTNIKPSMYKWFTPKQPHPDYVDAPYDYGGSLHYGQGSYTNDKRYPAFNVKDPWYKDSIFASSGRRLPFIDLQAVNEAYGCLDDADPNLCYNGGFQHPNNPSICHCPEGFGGDLCNQILPNGPDRCLERNTGRCQRGESKCGVSQVLQAQKTWRTLKRTFDNKNSLCYWYVTSPPGTVVELQMLEVEDYAVRYYKVRPIHCAGANWLEIITGDDTATPDQTAPKWGRTGFRICLDAPPGTKQAHSNLAIIKLITGSSHPLKFVLQYRYVPKPNAAVITPEELQLPYGPTIPA